MFEAFTVFQTRRRGPPPGRVVLTLDPRKFAEKGQRRLHIGNLRSFRLYVPLHNQSSPAVGKGPMLLYDRDRTTSVPPSYPPGTTAFLYYLTPPRKPRIAGEIRLRVSSSDDHASFESGSDLLKLDGQPWSRSLYSVSKYYVSLYEKLREDGLVPDDLDAVLSTFPRKNRKCQHLYKLNDTFIVDFSNRDDYFSVVTEQGVEKVQFPSVFDETRHGLKRRNPYTGIQIINVISQYSYVDDSVGRALARFERSNLAKHKGTRTVVLRFVKIITPATCVIPHYDGYIVLPKEGELHRRFRSFSDFNPPVWCCDIDKIARLRGLHLLWNS